MIAFAFLDIKIIVTRDAFQVLKLYKKKKNAIVTLLWLPNCSRFIWAAISSNVTKNTSLKLFCVLHFKHKFYSNWKLSKLRKSAIQKKCRIAFYNAFTLSSFSQSETRYFVEYVEGYGRSFTSCNIDKCRKKMSIRLLLLGNLVISTKLKM